jgi:hypothetical protein
MISKVTKRFKQANPGEPAFPIPTRVDCPEVDLDWTRYVYKLEGVKVPEGVRWPEGFLYVPWTYTWMAPELGNATQSLYRCPVEDWCDDCGRPKAYCNCNNH